MSSPGFGDAQDAMAPHSSTFAWKIPWMEEPGRLQSIGSIESDMTERLHFHFSLSCIGEGNGNPLQCSCLENPSDGEAWWAAIYGVAQSRTRLKRLSSSSRKRKLTHVNTPFLTSLNLTCYRVQQYFFFSESCNIIVLIQLTSQEIVKSRDISIAGNKDEP